MAYLFALCGIALWSTNAVTANAVLRWLPVEQVQFLQFLGAFSVFIAIRYRRHGAEIRDLGNGAAWALGIIGLTGTMILQYVAFGIGPITQVNIIAYAWPLLAVFFMIAVGGAKNPLALLSMAVVGFIGAGLVIGGDDFLAFNFTTSGFGFAAAAASALCMAIYTFGIGHTNTSANDVLIPGALVGLIITAIWCFSGNSNWSLLWPLVGGFYLGAGPMGLGYLFWSWAMQRDETGNAALLGFLTPITSTGLLLANGAMLDTFGLIGAVMVIFCCTVIGLQAHRQGHA